MTTSQQTRSGGRILSLDIFRGFTVAFMIMVNNQSGGAFAAMRHKSWDGCTPTDLVFPFFMFIVGISLWFSYRKTNHRLSGPVVWRLFRRGASIFLVGVALNWFPFYDFGANSWRGFDTLRIMGVLQRIGLSFFVGGVVALWLGSFRRIAIASGIILVGYWLGVELAGDATREGFVGNRIDGALLGVRHLHRPDLSFDPEGLFSTIPAVVTVLIGYMTGKFVGSNGRSEIAGMSGGNRLSQSAESAHDGGADSRIKILGGLGIAGGVLIMTALALNTVCPINKPIWSPSYVLYTAGLGMIVWLVLLWFYDYRGGRSGALLGAVFGTNALFAYVLAWVLMSIQWLPFFRFECGGKHYSAYSWLASRIASFTTPELGALLASLVLVGVIWCVIYPLYRRRIFIRL